LKQLRYDKSYDVLISAGDIVAKGPLDGSMSVLSYMAEHNVTAVRGNHDEKVIEWRSWIQWIHSLPAGKRWLRTLHNRFTEAQASSPHDIDPEEWVNEQKSKDRKRNSNNVKWWDRIPEGWTLFGPHYDIARKMSDAEYRYMMERPLRIHIPHAHTYIAHAGILASNPKYETHDHRQPLARMPELPHDVASQPKKHTKEWENALRHVQELAVLSQIPQNKDPWVIQNIRGVTDDGKVTR
jgi:hypothetical protein